MSRSLCHVAGVSDDGLRLDLVLAEHGCYASRSASARAAEEGLVLVNGTPAGKKHIVHVGDAIVSTRCPTTLPRAWQGSRSTSTSATRTRI